MLHRIQRYLLYRKRRKLVLKLRELRRERFELKRRHEAMRTEKQEELQHATISLLGATVLVWSQLEHNLDAWISVIHNEWGSTYIQGDLPPSLDRELDYLKQAWRTRDLDDDLQRKGETLISMVHRLKDFRHSIVHGLIKFDDDCNLIIETSEVKGSCRKFRSEKYDTVRLKEFVRRIKDAVAFSNEFILDLAADLDKRHSTGR